jgi:hypothetical protein
MAEQSWRVANGIMAVMQNEVGTDIAVFTNKGLPQGCSCDFSEF